MRKKRKYNFKQLLMAILMTVSVSAVTPAPANAAYDSGRIIDNSVFLNASSMNIADIQSFLVSKNSGLASKNFAFDCESTGMSLPYYQGAGAPCGQTVSAATIIYYASQIYGVNPQVALATMQKEQSLVTSPNPTSWQINQAMGYGCPDSGGCGTSNFLYQIDNGIWALRFHMERARGNMKYWFTSTGWVCGTPKNYYKPSLLPDQNVSFYDDAGVHYATHHIANAATSAFYCYTPHAYNNPQGLYGLPVAGTIGQYYSGSYNFVLWFERWFGSTKDGYCADTTENPITDIISNGRGLNFMIYSGASTRCVEFHTWSSSLNSWSSNKPSNSRSIDPARSMIAYADLTGNGTKTPILIGLKDTGSGMIEFHVWDQNLQAWSRHITSNSPTIDTSVSQVRFADLDGDGKDEGVLIGQGNGSTSTGRIEFHVWNQNLESWKTHITSNSLTLDPLISSIQFADLDGDGKDEGVLIGQGNGSTSTGRIEFHVWNQNLESWKTHITSNSLTLDPKYSKILFTDLDNNKKDDAILTGQYAPNGTGSGNVEFHVWSSSLESWDRHVISNQIALPPPEIK